MDLNTVDPTSAKSIAEWQEIGPQYESLLKDIYIAVPCRPQDSMNLKLQEAMMAWFKADVDTRPARDYMMGWIERTRNNIVVDFLTTSSAKYLIMIDSDIVPPILLPILLARHDKPVVSGVCMTVNGDHGPMLCFTVKDSAGDWRMPAMKYVPSIPSEGLIRTHHCGTGAICIRRDVLEAFTLEGEDWPFLLPMGIRLDSMRNKEMTKGEDIVFCIRARQKGFDLWVDLEAHCGHIKPFAMAWETARRDDTLSPESFVIPPQGMRITDNGV